MGKIIEIDNFVDLNQQLEIINYININKNLPYLFHTSCVAFKQFKPTKNTIDYPLVIYPIFSENKIQDNYLFSCVYNMLHKNKLSNNFIERIKININFPYPNNSKEKYGPVHTDRKENGISIIYYINDTDGDTVFFDKKLNVVKRVLPKQGKAIIFDSTIPHAGSCPINSKYRQNINFVLYK